MSGTRGPTSGGGGAPGENPRRLVDPLLDRELSSADARRVYDWLGAGGRDARAAADEIVAARRIEAALKSDATAPPSDLAHRVLADVGRRRGYLSRRGRRLVVGGRVALAAALVLSVAGVSLMRRSNPEWFHIAGAEPTPIERIESAAHADASGALRALDVVVDRAVALAASPEPQPTQPGADRIAWMVERASSPRLRELQLGGVALGDLTRLETPLVRGMDGIVALAPSAARARATAVVYAPAPGATAELGVVGASAPLGAAVWGEANALGRGAWVSSSAGLSGPLTLPSRAPQRSLVRPIVSDEPPAP